MTADTAFRPSLGNLFTVVPGELYLLFLYTRAGARNLFAVVLERVHNSTTAQNQPPFAPTLPSSCLNILAGPDCHTLIMRRWKNDTAEMSAQGRRPRLTCTDISAVLFFLRRVKEHGSPAPPEYSDNCAPYPPPPPTTHQQEVTQMSTILIVEDSPPISELIRRNLHLVGHTCTLAQDGPAAVDLLSSENYDLMILDIMLPGMDGYEIFRQFPQVPTIFLTAKTGLADKLKGLTMGAQDYLTKPFEMLELLARVENVLHRTAKNDSSFSLEDLTVRFDSRQVFLHGQPVDCTPKEYDLLETLVRNRNIALSRERLLELVWGYDYEGDTRTVDVHIQRLRRKLNLEERIKTVYKLGYRLEVTS